VPETLDALEKALIAHGAFAAGDLVPTKPEFKEPTEEEIKNGTAPHPSAGYEDRTGKRTDAGVRRNALLIYYIMYGQKVPEEEVKLDPKTNVQCGLVNTIATQLLIQCQQTFPKERLIQQAVTVANLSALFCNKLWSDTDPECIRLMKDICKETGATLPDVSIEARCSNHEVAGASILPKKQVAIDINMIRRHHLPPKAKLPECTNPQGIYEAYWCYVEALKEDGVQNPLVTASPIVCKDSRQEYVEAKFIFVAPEKPGKYKLRLHFCNTSIIGCYKTYDCSFVVEDDDVPMLN